MKAHSKNIELSKLATDAKSAVPSMVRELESISTDNEASSQRPVARFILAGIKLAFGSNGAGARN
jgi:hypothetical protein